MSDEISLEFGLGLGFLAAIIGCGALGYIIIMTGLSMDTGEILTDVIVYDRYEYYEHGVRGEYLDTSHGRINISMKYRNTTPIIPFNTPIDIRLYDTSYPFTDAWLSNDNRLFVRIENAQRIPTQYNNRNLVY